MSKTVVRAVLWTNGLVMAFGPDRQQVPEYQGEGTAMVPKIRRDFPGLVIEGMDWEVDGRTDLPFPPI